MLTIFGLLFGARERDVTSRNHGLVGAMAFDSVFKLAAFAVIAVLALGVMSSADGAPPLLPERISLAPDRFILLTILSGFMVLCLPRQFHMTVVEAGSEARIRRAAPYLVAYFFLFAVLVLPIAAAGRWLTPGSAPDLFVLSVPKSLGLRWFELFAFTGGFAAASGMIVVAGVALSSMIATDLVLPALSRGGTENAFGRALSARRLSLVSLMALAALFAVLVPNGAVLAELGVVAFAGAGQIAPLLVCALFLPQVPERAAFAGLLTGAFFWLMLVLGPAFFPGSLVDFGSIVRLALPIFSDDFTRGAAVSLLANVAAITVLTATTSKRLRTKEESSRFLALGHQRSAVGTVKVEDLEALLTPIIGEEETRSLLASGHAKRSQSLASAPLLAAAETKLSRVLGNASAHLLLTRLLSAERMDAGDVMVLVGDASRELRFGQELLATTLENLAEGVSVIDAEGRLVAWNRAYEELFRYPDGLLKVGTPVELLIRHNLPHLDDDAIERRVRHLAGGRPRTSETILPDGRIVRVSGRPVVGGGYVTSFADVTEYREAQAALTESERATRFYTDNVPFPIAFSDGTEVIRFHNKAYADMAGRSGEDLTGWTLHEILGQGYGLRASSISAVLAGHERRFVLSPDEIGGEVTWQVTYIPQVTDSGRVLGFFGFYQDISKRRAAQAALEEANRTLEARVEARTAELRAANAAADGARQEAEAANRSKTRFLAAASHDVLQPLNAARLFASSLEDAVGSDKKAADIAKKIGAAIVSADTLLRSLLNLSKIEAGGVDPKPEKLVLDAYLRGIAAEFQPFAEEKGLSLRVVATRKVAYTDPGLLRSALQNLVSNALRYTDQGGVLIGARRRGDTVLLQVVDTGRGIAPGDVPTIFDEFSRLDRDRDIDGAGLGLATVRRVCDLLGHPLEVTSVPGRGTIFSVALPAANIDPLPKKEARRIGADFEGKTVLCVDNDRAVLDALSLRFQNWGAHVESFRDVASVTAAYANGASRPDILVLDYQLDGEDTGLDVLRYMREAKGFDGPAILVTASRSAEMDVLVGGEGVPILAKPVEPAALRSLCVSLLNGRKA
jgi:PAS domain S-box-containing protein